jgi:hypothetical protein
MRGCSNPSSSSAGIRSYTLPYEGIVENGRFTAIWMKK